MKLKVNPLALAGLAILILIALYVGLRSRGLADGAPTRSSVHFESSTPAHGQTVAGVPIQVVVDVNLDLADGSEIKIFRDDEDYGRDETLIDKNKLAMRRAVAADAPDGSYIVKYKVCTTDANCDDGRFQFTINRSQASQFTDRRDQAEITIDMKNQVFQPKDIRISRGTKVVWTNQDDEIHFVNTDSHPAHTYYPDQNSLELKKGDSYFMTFDQPGVYPYHCSAHAATMSGTILVD